MELYSFLCEVQPKDMTKILASKVSVSLWSYIHSYKDLHLIASHLSISLSFRLLMELYSFLFELFNTLSQE